MAPITSCPFGFEDGQIVGYRADASNLEVDFEFWNEKRGTLVFEGLVGMHDNSAIGVTVGSVTEQMASPLVDALIRRRFEVRPEGLQWTHFQFLDLDDQPMFEIVAESGAYRENLMP